MYYLKLYAGWIAIFSFIVAIGSTFAGLVDVDENGEAKVKNSNTFYTAVGTVAFIVAVFLGIVRWVESYNYNIVVSTQTVNLLKASDVTPKGDLFDGGAYVEYLSHGIYEGDNYNGPVTVSSTAKVATVDIQVRKNIYGGQETVLAHLVVPKSFITKKEAR